jgi:putative hydrolase of the HAD superfamily
MPAPTQPHAIRLVGFDADDTLWRSEDFYRDAQREFEAIVARYVDLEDVHTRLYAVEKRNLALFGYGAKGMTLSMLEAAIEITDARVSAVDLQRIVAIGKSLLQHPVALLPGIRDTLDTLAASHALVLITKGDLHHQRAKVEASGLADYFARVEVFCEKDRPSYARLLAAMDVAPDAFVMVGNSLRSDIAPVLALGGWGVHLPYHVTWAHEAECDIALDAPRLRQATAVHEIPALVRALGVE